MTQLQGEVKELNSFVARKAVSQILQEMNFFSNSVFFSSFSQLTFNLTYRAYEYSGTSEHGTNNFVPCREVVPISEVKCLSISIGVSFLEGLSLSRRALITFIGNSFLHKFLESPKFFP